MRKTVVFAAGLLLAGSAEAQQTEARFADAYAKAVGCLPKGRAPKLRFDQINVVVMPLENIDVPRPEEPDERLVRAAFTPSDSTIWIAEPYVNEEWVVVHEFLHAVGVRGHGAPFNRCRLLESHQQGWRPKK